MSRVNVRAYIAVVLFAVALAVIFGVGIAQNQGIFHRPATEQSFNAEAFNNAVLAPGGIGLASLDFSLRLIPPSSSEEKRAVTIELDYPGYYVRDDNLELDVVRVCLDYVQITLNYEGEPNDFFRFLDLASGTEQCIDPAEGFFHADPVTFGGVTIDNYYYLDQPLAAPAVVEINSPDYVSQNFWYPFDNFAITAVVSVDYSVELSDGSLETGTISPYMAWEIQTSGTRLWDVRLDTVSIEVEAEDTLALEYALIPGIYDQMTFSFSRPLLYQVVTPVFIVAMVLLIAMVPLLGDRDTLVDICAAMLFGIFGIKGILGPGAEMGQTLLDISLIGLYVVLGFAAVLFFIRKIGEQRESSVNEAAEGTTR